MIADAKASLRMPLILAQYFGMFPVSGIKADELYFKWTSPICLYCTFIAFGAGFNFICSVCKMIIYSNYQFMSFVGLLFYFVSFLTLILFINLAREFPLLITQWKNVDTIMEFSYVYSRQLTKKTKIITIVVMLAAALEHGMFLAKTLIGNTILNENNVFKSAEIYFCHRHDHVFVFLPCNLLLGIYIQILNVISTFSWNYMDLFIMLISVALAARFQQITVTVQYLAETRIRDVADWRKIREDYTRLSALCKIIDTLLSNITTISFANNLFVILVQLFNSLQQQNYHNLLEKIYFSYSFGFLIVRTAIVAIYASTIFSESTEPIYSLNLLHDTVYNDEIERFINQIKFRPAYLTGHGLFVVTKSLMLHVAAAIVTYELILIQYNK